MPKDNEVDEKVKPVAWIVTNGGETCEPWIEYEKSEVDALPSVCVAEPLYSAATVADLRADRDSWREQAEDRLREWDKLRAEVAENESVINVWRRRCEAAERRVGELEAALRDVLSEHANDNHRPNAFYIAANAIAKESQ